MLIELLGTVTLRGKNAYAGEEIDIPEDSAGCLVAAGLAQYPGEEVTPPAAVDQAEVDAAAAAAMVTRALDNQYKRDELAAAAKDAGVDFPYDAKKAEIIVAVMEQGQEATLLK